MCISARTHTHTHTHTRTHTHTHTHTRTLLARALLARSCDPNCETQKWHDAATGEPRIGIFATRDIKPGEELTYDYFFQHYGVSAVDTADFICMCGAPNCRCVHEERSKGMT
eukprot:1141157-Pelagomonas_calceolata.AAC.5